MSPRCALVVLPADGGDSDRLLRSLDTAKAYGLGDLFEVTPLLGVSGSPRDMLLHAAEAALAGGFDWLLAVTAAETLSPDIFVKIAPALRLHDAVWGAAGLSGAQTPAQLDPNPISTQQGGVARARPRDLQTGKPERITRLAAQDLPGFFHAALAWWIGPTHFIRPHTALPALHAPVTAAWYAQYMLEIWRTSRAYKTAQALTAFPGPLPVLRPDDRAHLIAALERDPVFITVHHDAHALRLPYTGVNPVIEREQTRGQFFEPDELRFLADRMPRGLSIVDAGANTGNHTVFFAAVMAAQQVVPLEPHPRAVSAIRASVAENGLGNVDLSCLGIALGADAGRLRPVLSAGGGLGATRYVAERNGEITLAPLDSLRVGAIDLLKIDVEGMEMEVLAGAASTIARFRPAIYIEILDANVGPFMAWTDAHQYRVEKLFPDKTHCNYLVVPVET